MFKTICRNIISSIVKTRGVGGYDYLITNDAEWTSTFALGAATLSGKTIAVAPGSYTSKTISSFAPSSNVTLRALNPTVKPVINGLTLNNASKIDFEHLWLQNNLWNATPKGCVDLANTCSDLSFTYCDIRGNYRGTVNPTFDLLTDDIPEYACIIPQFAADGTLASLIRLRDYVGDLLADGPHTITFTAASGYSFSVSPEATFTVSGGFIVSTTITNVGASNHPASINSSTGILSKICTWPGQVIIGSRVLFGFRGVSPSTINNLTISDCNFDFLGNAIKPSGVAGPVTFQRNTFSRIYQDYISIGCGQNNFPMTITDNFTTTPFSVLGDAGDPHSDVLQFFMNDGIIPYTPQDWSDVVIERNVHVDGPARGGVQGMIVADSPANIAFSRWRIVGNHISSRYLGMGINLTTPKDCYIAYNTMIFTDPTNSTDNTTARYIGISRSLDSPHGGPFAFGNSLVLNNIAETFTRGVPDNIKINLDGNVTLGLRGVTIPYGDVFVNPTASRLTLSETIAAYTPKIGYAGKGAFGVSYINHINRTTDRSQESSYVAFEPLLAQSVATMVTSNWSCVIAGQNGRSISVSGGEYRIADDAIGTNATAWTTSPSTINVYKFVQCRHTTAASGSTETHTTLTIGSQSFDFVSTTASTAVFIAVDNQATAYSAMARPGSNETAIKKILLACRFKIDTLVANANIMASLTAGTRFWTPTTGSMRYQLIGATRANLRPTFTPTTTGFVTHFISLDFSNTNANEGCYWATDLDGVVLNNTPGSGGTFDTRSVAGTGTDYGAWEAQTLTGTLTAMFGTSGSYGLFGESDGGGVLLDGRIEFFWMDWGTASYTLPDITQASVRNQWTADLIGANGQGPTGSIPKIYYTGNASAWNAGLTNLGSLTLPLTRQAGTYT